MCHFRVQNGPFAFNNFFLVQTIVVSLIYLLVLFIVQNFKKFLQQIQRYDDASFLCPKWTICPKQCFFGKLLLSLSSTYQPLSLCKFEKKVRPAYPEFSGCAIFRPKTATFPQMRIFFRRPVNEPCFFHSCQSAGQKLMSAVNLLVKY